MLPTPPPNPLLALLQVALGQAHPLMDGSTQMVPYQAGVGTGGINPGGPMVPAAAPMPAQGQGLAPPDGGLGENAHLGWGTAPPMDYHTALRSSAANRKAPARKAAAPARRGAGDFPSPNAAHAAPTRRGTGDFHRGGSYLPLRPPGRQPY
ncbi:MAG TPA: hypothetical protein VN903_14850 [Polyangia bacterium]|nr:hypothetical protein [Polyangia bacterium]